jgi:hypothetical protein
MNPAYLPAFAALAGRTIGGLTSFASARLSQHLKDRAKRLSEEKTRSMRHLYADALVHDRAEVLALVSVYALISRMLIVSSSAVIEGSPPNSHEPL